MKKLLIPVLVITFIIGIGGFAYKYFNGPKISKGTVSKSIDKDGKPADTTDVFSPQDTIYFSAKGKRLLVKKARVVWYKGKIAAANRFKVENDIARSSAGYFSAKLSVPEGLEEGLYYVGIYAEDSNIIQTMAKFDVKKQ